MLCGGNGYAGEENARHPGDRSLQTYISRHIKIIAGKPWSCIVLAGKSKRQI